MRVIFIFLLILPFSFKSQINIDSLWSVWNDESQPDTNKLFAMQKIAFYGYLFDYPDSAFYYSQIEYDLANKINDKRYMAKALNTKGASFYMKSDFNKAIDYYSQSLKIEEEQGNLEGVATLYANIGLIYRILKEYDKAIEYQNNSLNICREINREKGIAMTLGNLGTIYQDLNEYETALEYQQESLKIRQKIEDKVGEALALGNIGLLYYSSGDLDTAMDYQLRSLEIRKVINDKGGICLSLINMGDIYFDKGQILKAKELGNKALPIAQEIQVKVRISEAAELLWKVEKALNNYEKSLEMYELFQAMQDSIQSEENKQEVIRQEYKYEYEKQLTADSIKSVEEKKIQEAEIARKNAEIESKEKEKMMLYGGLGLIALFSLFIFNRFRVTSKQNKVIELQKNEVEKQKLLADQQRDKAELQQHLVEEKNKEIMDSIHYAKRIQSAILPLDENVNNQLGENFVLYKPKDVVAGDFYWLEQKDDNILFAACDCTGHGVPGAMVSVVCVTGLNRSVREHGLVDPGLILDRTREIVIQEFEKSEEGVQDGMDVALCSLKKQEDQFILEYAGAYNPLWIIRKDTDEVEEVKPDKQPVGKYVDSMPFTTKRVELKKGDLIYVFSDGYADQFGGEKGKKYKTVNFKKYLLKIKDLPMSEQKEMLDQNFENWRGEIDQIDDVCVIGVRL